MVVEQFPQTAVITWNGAGTQDSNGVYTEGAESSVTIECDVQPKSGRIITGPDKDDLKHNWLVYCEKFAQAPSVPAGAEISFLGLDFKIIQIFSYANHVEIKC